MPKFQTETCDFKKFVQTSGGFPLWWKLWSVLSSGTVLPLHLIAFFYKKRRDGLSTSATSCANPLRGYEDVFAHVDRTSLCVKTHKMNKTVVGKRKKKQTKHGVSASQKQHRVSFLTRPPIKTFISVPRTHQCSCTGPHVHISHPPGSDYIYFTLHIWISNMRMTPKKKKKEMWKWVIKFWLFWTVFWPHHCVSHSWTVED